MARDWRDPVDGIRADAAGDDIDQPCRVTHQDFAGKHRTQIHCIQRLGMRRHQHELLKAQSWIDALDPELHEAQKMGDVACRPRRADGNHLFGPVDAQPRQAERPRTEPPRLQHRGQIAEQVLHDLRDRVCGDDRFEQPALHDRHDLVGARRDGFGDRAECLIEPRDCG